MEHVVIIGGGGTGAALAHDLVLRGFKASLYERGELLSGTTGRHHGLLHSGARYAVSDPQAAVECIQENKILRQIAPQAIEQNDGLFVAINDADMAYRRVFLEKCEECGIPILELRAEQALAIEPALHPEIKTAVQVPDATMDAWRLPMCFFATAKANGAAIHSFSEVTDVHLTNGSVTSIQIFNHKTHREHEVHGDLFVNAAGAWSGRICEMAGIQLPIQPGPGVMLALKGRLINMVISRLHKAAEGDIIVPQRNLTILGTTLWLDENPDAIEIPADHVRKIADLCSEMVPMANNSPIHSVWCASRPLIKQVEKTVPQEISRAFDCFDHKRRDNIEGLISVTGGKATTLRAMSEKSADLICRKTGRSIPCQTKTEKLMHWRMFYQ